MTKKKFVENQLTELVKSIFTYNGEINRLIYQNYDNPKFPVWEAVYVEINAADDLTSDRVITVNVSADSLTAITRDVLKALEEKY